MKYKSFYGHYLLISLISLFIFLLFINNYFSIRSILSIAFCIALFAYLKKRISVIELDFTNGIIKIISTHYFRFKTTIYFYELKDVTLIYLKTKGARNTNQRVFVLTVNDKNLHKIEVPIDGWSEDKLFVIQKKINDYKKYK